MRRFTELLCTITSGANKADSITPEGERSETGSMDLDDIDEYEYETTNSMKR